MRGWETSQMHTATAGTSRAGEAQPKKHLALALPKKAWGGFGSSQPVTQQHLFPNLPCLMCPQSFPPSAPIYAPHTSLLYSVSFLLVVLSFLMISCFLDFTMAELLSVSLLKNAGGCVLFPGDLDPILQSKKPSATSARPESQSPTS